MVRIKGSGPQLRIKKEHSIPKELWFTDYELGLTDENGTMDGEMWKMLSRKKAPGTNNMLDEIFFSNNMKARNDRREDLANWIRSIFNEGKKITEKNLEVKTMFLSKKDREIAESLQEIRMICIS